jgi:hypothetical protein
MEYVIFRDDKKGKVLDTGIIKVNNHFICSIFYEVFDLSVFFLAVEVA